MNHRYGRRMSVNVPATIVNSGGDRFSARIRNFSISGFYLDVAEREQRPYEALEIELRGLQDSKLHRIDGRVVRVEENGVAVMLDDSIPKSLVTFNLLREYARTSPPLQVEGAQKTLRLVESTPDSTESSDASDDTEFDDISVTSMAGFSGRQRAKKL